VGDAAATVIIVNYNGAHLLGGCLDALDAQREPGVDFETVVVDNASQDDSLALLAGQYPWVRVIRSPDNLGFAGGNNLALREARTPFAVLLNNDATPEPGWLRNLLSAFEGADGDRIGIVTGKIVFMPKFAALTLDAQGFSPGPADTRELGVRIYQVAVDGVDVTDKVMWQQAAYGPEGSGAGRYRWTRPSGTVLIPVPREQADAARPITVAITAAAERTKTLTIASDCGVAAESVSESPTTIAIELEPGTAFSDVINNVGGIVLNDGSGADRGFQEVDQGQYDEPCEVFTACGNGMALRTSIGRDVGWFDDTFFMYYEDTDLSWRWRSCGWSIRYLPTAQLRHIHSASSKEWSPRWLFHVERNRLLMLTKNANSALARKAVFGYLLSTAAALLRDIRNAVRTRRRPPVRVHLLRLRIIRSYLRLLPHAIRERRRIGQRAVVDRTELQRYLVDQR
jgi:GT2 family glycosyltransferase